jgi:hypothetical protein
MATPTHVGSQSGWNWGRMTWKRIFGPAGAVLALLGTCLDAGAQRYPTPPGSIPISQQQLCVRLEGQLAAIDRGPNDPSRAAQISRSEDALRRQQAELDRIVVHSRRLGCEKSSFFSLFVNQPAECTALTKQIQQMHITIDRLMVEAQRAQGGTADREAQRRSVLIALGENDCGPQYRQAAVNRSRGLFDSLFSPGTPVRPDASDATPEFPQSSTYRTLCVRTCDGYYWPISFSTVPSRFGEDNRVCQRMCPAAQVTLFTYRNPGEDVAQAVSQSGQVYRDMPNAFLYRKQFSSTCSCRRAGETWAHALQNLDDTIQRGDIVVTEERAKQLSMPREQRAKSTPRGGRDAAPQTSAANPATASPPLRGNVSDDAAADNKVRSVGPTFLPGR